MNNDIDKNKINSETSNYNMETLNEDGIEPLDPELKTILKELPLKHEITFHHEVYNERKKLLTTGKVVLFFIDIKTGKWIGLPNDLRETLTPFFTDQALL